ncbi:hypothetical protein MP638_001875 [Amoeboaphelidium occidentale]|nr:hypothetical protein MP638_001875 [Amoeboaphelidium occidentale]
MSSVYNFKKIAPIPTSNDFIDIVLSKTQRKTPTQVHKHFQISRIRAFYMRKVKFTQDSFEEKLNQILEDFPKLDEIHPFFADLINVLYDRDHYKLALGQLNTARNLINNVGRDYSRLLKFGDSLFRCKQLKKAALGRMATIMKRQKETLEYLEQVRQHLSRLPSVDPTSRTLLLCGYPNVGKSSFMNKVTRADVDVQPYAFTTKSLFVGHMDYKYLRWQVIDTPGILDHPLDERNTIEMLSITALAHLRACVMYFMDLSEQCGYSIAEQAKLFHSIKPLFNNKPIVLVFSKIDVRKPDDLNEDELQCIQSILNEGVVSVQLSSMTDEGVMDARNFACDKLLAARVESKIKSSSISGILNKIHVSIPKVRDDKDRPPVVPVVQKSVENVRKTEKEIEIENGGAGVYNIDLKKMYDLEVPEWKYDIIPEIMDGHNVADWIDPEIERKLEELEEEEDQLAAAEESKVVPTPTEEDKKIRKLAKEIKDKKKLVVLEHRMKKVRSGVKPIKRVGTKAEFIKQLASRGLEIDDVSAPVKQKRKIDEVEDIAKSSAEPMEEDFGNGVRNVKQKLMAESIAKKSQRKRNLDARKGEGDRVILQSKPKHLFSGKRGLKSDRR